ncbi:hypothetical protein DF044_24105 [Burkholderia contaminans]|uniref:hypothetical protein n=1 Tax=Burkholderia contaminans TaxID=488447 RepID=UPI000F5B3339|nr:hypothetical protein [Burkholderia contaminans]MCA8153363.1 hypothetical protein [Burkholderia contaminans]RQT09546.1 hypothetical protein DF044_24105 [Burkholderia contaminans]VWD59734.1 hypothetical protein BCO19218_07134 [Burkholderia contaminans]
MIGKAWGCIVGLVSGEWVVTRWLKTNGGDAILFRACWVTLLVGAVVMAIRLEWVRALNGDEIDTIHHLLDIGGWLSAVFGGVYLALYARFSSQWSYLASLYNQIKQTEATAGVSVNVLASWKAGFIEDAENLHLACKSSFAPVIKAWATDAAVVQAFADYAPGSRSRWNKLQERVNAAVETIENKYK